VLTFQDHIRRTPFGVRGYNGRRYAAARHRADIPCGKYGPYDGELPYHLRSAVDAYDAA